MRQRSWTKEQLHQYTLESTSVRQVLKRLGLREAGGNYAQLKKYFEIYQIDHSHFSGKGWNRGKTGFGYKPIALEKLLVNPSYYGSHSLKKRLFKEGVKKPACEECGWAQQSPDGRIPVELDHINGDRLDNRLENLRILCPNCHSLKPTHRALNRKRKG